MKNQIYKIVLESMLILHNFLCDWCVQYSHACSKKANCLVAFLRKKQRAQ